MTVIPDAVRRRVRAAAGNCCGYCRSAQRLVMGQLEIEHIVPRVMGGTDDEANLWLACGLCKRYKAAQVAGTDPVSGNSVPLFNPRVQTWSEHFRWSADGARILGLTSVGRATEAALRLNSDIAVEVRRNWVLAGWHPPEV